MATNGPPHYVAQREWLSISPQPTHYPQYPRNLAPPNPTPSASLGQAKTDQKDYETLCQTIKQWNENRLDMFALSLPNEVRSFAPSST
jgi:hypothetical protein